MAEYVPQFFITGDKFSSLLLPDILLSLKTLSADDMLGLLLLKNQSHFLINFIEKAKATETETRPIEGQKSNS